MLTTSRYVTLKSCIKPMVKRIPIVAPFNEKVRKGIYGSIKGVITIPVRYPPKTLEIGNVDVLIILENKKPVLSSPEIKKTSASAIKSLYFPYIKSTGISLALSVSGNVTLRIWGVAL